MKARVDEKWPFHFSEILLKGNPGSSVAVCTLWTLKEKFLPLDNFALIGNMYYDEGVSYILRGILSNPNIRYLVLCGVDISKSGEALVKLFKDGIDDNHMIVGTDVGVHKELPKEAIEDVRKHVFLIDMRGIIDREKVASKMRELEPLDAFGEPRTFPMPEMKKVDTFPSEETGFIVREGKIADAWLRIVRYVMRFGKIKKSQHSSDMRELINLVSVVGDENPSDPYLTEFLPFGIEEIENYYPQVMSAKGVPGTKYTYGQKLRDFRGLNQVEYIIEDLKRTQYSRRAVAVTWDPENDRQNENPPCWLLIQCIVREEKLYLTCYIRSNDMFAAWPLNAFGLRKMQQEIATSLGLKLGDLTTVSGSAHIYSHDWNKANELIGKHEPSEKFVPDPRGNFVIRLDREKQELSVVHYSPEQKQMQEFRGKSAVELYRMILDVDAISMAGHMMDIGCELQKAEIALKQGIVYEQDKPLDFGKNV